MSYPKCASLRRPLPHQSERRAQKNAAVCCQRWCAALCQGHDLITIYQSHWAHIRLIWWESSQTRPYIFDQRLGLRSPLLLSVGILIQASSVKWTRQDGSKIWRPLAAPHSYAKLQLLVPAVFSFALRVIREVFTRFFVATICIWSQVYCLDSYLCSRACTAMF